MSKCFGRSSQGPVSGGKAGVALLIFAGMLGGQDRLASEPASRQQTLIQSQVERARNEIKQVQRLVEAGSLPRAKLAEAKLRLADAEDEATLARTLFGQRTVEDLTEEEANEMVAAARRRMDRSSLIVEDRRRLLDSGAIARVDFQNAADDLEDKKRVYKLAQDRLQLLKELKAMAESERELARSQQTEADRLKESMIRYDGNGSFTLGDLTTIEAQFRKRFHRDLPVSALGQTLVHQSLGLDHRNRVDIALSPDQQEGIWLRALLEKLHVPYLAFRAAVAGAATAPHIHVGVGSTRLRPGVRERG